MTTATMPTISTETIQQGQARWRAHRDWARRVPFARAWRPWLGIALLLDGENTGLVENDRVTWATLFDLPAGYLEMERQREAYWFSVRLAEQRYAMPFVGQPPRQPPATFDGSYQPRQYDFRSYPGRSDGRNFGGRDSLQPEEAPQLFCVADLLNTALSAASAHYAPCFQRYRNAFYRDVLETEPNPGEALVPLGADVCLTERIPHPRTFMPRPYLGFRAPVVQIFERSLHPFPNKKHSYYPPALVGRFLDTYYGHHEAAHADMPPRWQNTPLRRRWDGVIGELGRDLLPCLRAWFISCAREIGALNYLPADIVAPAARRSAVANSLRWDLEPCRDYWQPTLRAYVLPPLSRRGPERLCGVWPGEIVYDLTPSDPRFCPPRCSR